MINYSRSKRDPVTFRLSQWIGFRQMLCTLHLNVMLGKLIIGDQKISWYPVLSPLTIPFLIMALLEVVIVYARSDSIINICCQVFGDFHRQCHHDRQCEHYKNNIKLYNHDRVHSIGTWFCILRPITNFVCSSI